MRNKALALLLVVLTTSCSASREDGQAPQKATDYELGFAAVQYTLAAMEANVQKAGQDTTKDESIQKRHKDEANSLEEISSKYKNNSNVDSIPARFYLDLGKTGVWDMTAKLTIGILSIDSIKRERLSDYNYVLEMAKKEGFCDPNRDRAYFDKASESVKTFLGNETHRTNVFPQNLLVILCTFATTILLTLAIEHKVIPLLRRRRRDAMDAQSTRGDMEKKTVRELSEEDKNQLKLSGKNKFKQTPTGDVPPKCTDEKAAPVTPSHEAKTKPDKASPKAQSPISESSHSKQDEVWHARIVKACLEECGEDDARKRFTIKKEGNGFSFTFSGGEKKAINNPDELKVCCKITGSGKSGIKTKQKGICEMTPSSSNKKTWTVTKKTEIEFF